MHEEIKMTRTIQVTLVDENERLSFLPKYFDKWMLSAENRIYDILNRFCSTYKGAYWNFYELSNGGFYMAPELKEMLHLVIESNGFSGEMSADASGLISTLYVLNTLCYLSEDEQLINRYYWLRDYADEHPEAGKIFAAID